MSTVSLSVLVVDDSDVIRRMIVKTMRLAELATDAVYEAANGREALDVMGANWIDVVLADLNMPVMDGLEMIQTMRRSPEFADIPVIVVSTEGAESRIDELERLGIAAYLRKPFTPEQIRDTLRCLPVAPRAVRAADDVQEVVCDVLERFTLMFAEPVGGACPAPTGELLLARTGLRGALMGIVSVAAPVDLATEMAGNALGMDESDEDIMLRAADVLGEVVNMVGGHLASAFDCHEHTAVSPPIVTRFLSGDWAAMEALSSVVRLDVEGRPVLASFTMRADR
ncbi:MAG: response regulator [Coriobacteriia bacterium]|nr:response regulator [Coriobacteriia bacterium]